jgi:hypothetical protein
MKKNYIVLYLLIYLVNWSFAQNEFNKEIWKNRIETGDVSQVQDIEELSSGNLAILSVGDIGTSQLTLMKRTGETIRSISFNKKKSHLKSILELPNGQLMLSGYTYLGKEKRNEGWLILISKNGEQIWEKQFGGQRNDVFNKMVLFDLNNVLISGITDSNKKEEVWLVKINLVGEVVWEKKHQIENANSVNSLLKINDGFVIGGQSVSSNNENAFLLKVNLEGAKEWSKLFSEETTINKGIVAFDDKLIYVGYIFNEKGSIQRDVWALKISPNDGNVLWKESYKAVNDDVGNDLVELIDGRILLTGKSYSNATGSNFANTWNLNIQAHDGRSKEEIKYFDSKIENFSTFVKYANNRDLMIAGTWEEKPFISRYKTITSKKPKITIDKRNRDEEVEKIGIGLNDNEANLNFSATIISPVLIKKEDIKIYWNNKIQLNEKYYKNIVLEKPYKSTENEDQFIYRFSNKIPISKKDSSVEIRLYNNLFSVRSGEHRFQLLRDFDIDIFWISHAEGNYQNPLPKLVADNNVNIKLMVECTEELDKNSFEILINGERTEGAKYGETIIDPRKLLKNKEHKSLDKYQYTYLNNVYLKQGQNKIKLQIRINGVLHDSKELIRVYNGQEEIAGYLKVDTTFDRNFTNLHVLAIGVEHSDLKYTVQDAKDISTAFKSLEGRGLFKQVNVETIVGEKANKTEIDIALERYKNAYRIGEITNKDVFVLFVSSHGFIYKDSIAGATDWITFEKFLIQASNFDNSAKQATSVSYENIISTLAAIRCKKIVLIDACFSGGVNRSTTVRTTDNESINDLITQLSFQQPGLVTITSSTKSQPSYEDKSWQNGAFTEAIIDAFTNGDINGDKVVTLSEMYSHISKQIPSIVKSVKQQSQQPTITTEKLGNIPIYEMK